MSKHVMPSRSLILAGGGLKVAFQAGVLQVWLDEANLQFDHADGASGGIFNLAMYCQGMSGTEIANNWRSLPILRGIGPNWRELWKLIFAGSILTYRRWRRNIFPHWNIDWDKIRASDRQATFNLYNFTTHQLEVREADEMTEEALISGVSLPMWFPAVRMRGHDYIDPVYMTDANLFEAIRRGADELWIIWTVSERSVWRDGFIAHYFQIIETAANGRFRADLARIKENNAEINAGRSGEFGRIIEVKILRAEVPLHYLLNFRSSRFTKAVDLGVSFAREWCRQQGVSLTQSAAESAAKQPTYLEFTETMKGDIEAAAIEADAVSEQDSKAPLTVRLTIQVDDVAAFVADPEHQARADGYVECSLFGGRREVRDGEFNLFVDTSSDGTDKRMRYRLPFRNQSGQLHTLIGHKEIHDDPGFDLWSDTTTLYTTITSGTSATTDADGEVVASGIISIHMLDFLEQLTTFRTRGPTLAARMEGLGKFGRLFLGALWQVYRGRAEDKAFNDDNR